MIPYFIISLVIIGLVLGMWGAIKVNEGALRGDISGDQLIILGAVALTLAIMLAAFEVFKWVLESL